MKRINYLVSPIERRFGIGNVTVKPALRVPVAALVAAVALDGLMWITEEARLRSLERETQALGAKLESRQLAAAPVRALEIEVTGLREASEHARALRVSGVAHANEIAALGDRLPADSWFTGIRLDPEALRVEARGASVASVGSALRSLAGGSAYATAHLISVHEDPSRSGVTYAITLERAR